MATEKQSTSVVERQDALTSVVERQDAQLLLKLNYLIYAGLKDTDFQDGVHTEDGIANQPIYTITDLELVNSGTTLRVYCTKFRGDQVPDGVLEFDVLPDFKTVNTFTSERQFRSWLDNVYGEAKDRDELERIMSPVFNEDEALKFFIEQDRRLGYTRAPEWSIDNSINYQGYRMNKYLDGSLKLIEIPESWNGYLKPLWDHIKERRAAPSPER
jgi:hypothetical protein